MSQITDEVYWPLQCSYSAAFHRHTYWVYAAIGNVQCRLSSSILRTQSTVYVPSPEGSVSPTVRVSRNSPHRHLGRRAIHLPRVGSPHECGTYDEEVLESQIHQGRIICVALLFSRSNAHPAALVTAGDLKERGTTWR